MTLCQGMCLACLVAVLIWDASALTNQGDKSGDPVSSLSLEADEMPIDQARDAPFQHLKWENNETDSRPYKSYVETFISLRRMSEGSCKDKCGLHVGTMCSCKPYCYYTRSCCFDFVDQCGGKFSSTVGKISDAYAWLDDVSMECEGSITMVSSCRQGPPSNKIPEDGLFNLMTIDESNLENGNSTFISVVQYLQYLTDLMRENQGEQDSLSPSQSLLVSWPVHDKLTGITYRNKSIFDCNGANQANMSLVGALFVSLSSSYLTYDATTSLDGLLQGLNLNSWQSYPGQQGYAPEPCDSDVTRTCPHVLENDDIKDACMRIAFGVNALYHVGESELGGSYKNPYCMACHLGLNATILRMHILPNEFRDDQFLEALVAFDFMDGVLTARSVKVSVPILAWQELKCGPKSADIRLLIEHKRQEEVDDSESVQPGDIEHVCVPTACNDSPLRYPCRFDDTFTMFLPPTPTNMTSDVVENWIAKLQEGLPTILFQGTDRPEGPLQVSTKEISRSIKGRVYARSLSVSFQPQVLLKAINFRKVAHLLMTSGFVFHEDLRYFCAFSSYQLTNPSLSICANVDDVIHPSTPVPDDEENGNNPTAHGDGSGIGQSPRWASQIAVLLTSVTALLEAICQ